MLSGIDRNVRVALMGVAMVVGMTGMGFASVPLYRLFCQVTGFGGTPMRADAAPGAVDQKVEVRFDANVSPALGWSFAPERAAETIDVGGRDMAFYTATNNTGAPVTGTATFNVTPSQAGKYFSKIQCFCFTEQTLQPGETMRMPVIFFVDPKMLDDPDARDIESITLSYTFYPVDRAGGAS